MEIKWLLLVFGIILTSSGVCEAAIKCIQCDSSTENCKTNPTAITATECSSTDSTKCYTLVENNGNIKRGCVLSSEEKCEGKNCKSCEGDGCNKENPLRCKLCKSSETSDCAFWKSPDSIPFEMCADGITTCRMEITDDNHTSRRCSIKDDKECPSGKCSTCTDSGCNKDIFPTNRRKCYQCKSDNANCAKTPTADMSSACLLFEDPDSCYEYGTSETSMSRGCKSDTTEYQKCTSETPKEKCKECTADNCNSDEFKVASTVKCIKCSSEESTCVGSQSSDKAQECSKIEYWKANGCYTNRVEAGKVARGCLAEFDCSGNSATCSSCTTNACNIDDKSASSCYKCRSDENAKCVDAYAENNYKPEPCRNTLTIAEGFQCYVERWNGIVIRSCLSDADAKSRKHCLDTNQKTCKTCKGDNCNTEKAPDSAYSIALTSGLLAACLLVLKPIFFDKGKCFAMICFKCDSITLPECATSLDSEKLPTETCNSAYSCASSIVDSVTYRGCSSNTPRGPKYYITCSESLCNKGVYPPGRLKCHQCSGKSCVPQPVTKPTPCLNFVEDDNCYTDVIDEIETFRGCDSDTKRTPSGSVLYCDINGCNNLPAVETLTCSKCDSHDARGCKMDLFEIYNSSCVIKNETTCSDLALLGHEQPSCFLYINLDHVVRGCSSDSGILSLDSQNYDLCATNLCNKKCLKQQKCVVCDSSTSEACLSNPALLTASTCEGAEVSSCNSCLYKDDSVRRGCGSPLQVPDARCNECQDDSCNKSNFTKCYKCSSDDSPNCGQWINPNIIDVEYCEIAGAGCVSAVLSNGKTVRGCESPQLTCNSTQSSCYPCSGNLCNDGVYPTARLRCHHCDGRDKCSNVVDTSNMLPCAVYDKSDACFEFLSGRNTMVRGCRSDSNLYYECLLAIQSGKGCRLCTGSGCNMMPVSRNASLLCHKCSREDQGCSWFQGINETMEMCQKEVKFLTTESCYTRLYSDGSTSRGCSLDENETDEDDEYLEHICEKNGCNGKSQIAQKCIECREKINEANICTTTVVNLEGNLCSNGTVRFEERGCYTKIDGDFIERGCASDLTSDDLKECQQGNGTECHYCQGIECNTSFNLTFVPTRNSGSFKFLRASFGLNLGIFFYVFWF
ncbi:uncharacterized protein LOC129907015 [Episyrphus balteatus]|uniref:uncharacterized protein LOC129907015 n=1 Tax=Episyrphus balteatus TaxID=286459 RepID=UPI002485ACB6|nr:uncharacterized protein LOC129907015 [Episyrphus balteatus]